MEQSDLLDSESIEKAPVSTDAERGNFGVLILSIILDRFSYYGFRSLIVLYVIETFDFSREVALHEYGFFTFFIYMCAVLGGVLGDFVFKSKLAITLGSLISAVGAALCAIPMLNLFYAGCILVIIGSALYRVNLSAHIVKITGRNIMQLDKRFLALYTVINVGAFLGALILGLASVSFGYAIGFIVCAIPWMCSGLIVLLARDSRKQVKQVDSRSPHPLLNSNYQNLAWLIIPLIAVIFYWVGYEFVSFALQDIFYDHVLFDSASATILFLTGINSLAVVVFGGLLLLIFKKMWFHPLQRMGLGIVLFASIWFSMDFLPNRMNLNFAVNAYILISIATAISELFITPAMLTFIGALTPRKILGTVFGIYFVMIGFGIKWLNADIHGRDPMLTVNQFAWITLSMGILLFIIPLIVKSIRGTGNSMDN